MLVKTQRENEMKIKKVVMYEIRCWVDGQIFSKRLSNKLKNRKRATALVKRLKKSGIDAFAEKVIINEVK